MESTYQSAENIGGLKANHCWVFWFCFVLIGRRILIENQFNIILVRTNGTKMSCYGTFLGFLTGFQNSQKLTFYMFYTRQKILGSKDSVFIIGIISIK